MIASGLVANGVRTYITARKAEACDAAASELDLVVPPPGEDEPLLVVHDLVAAAVGALPAEAVMGGVLLRVPGGVEVAAESDAADDQFADLAFGNA